MEVSEQEAVRRFATLMNGFIDSPPASARVVVDALVEEFRVVRVAGAQDKLQFEWGVNSPHKLVRFADLRTEELDGWEDESYQWLGVTRELGAGEDDDDTALCAFLYFGAGGEDEPSGLVACRTANLDSRLAKFLGDAGVSGLLTRAPSRITAFASEVG